MSEQKEPKILVYDIETSPHLIEAWGTYQTDALKVVRESYILCFAYKWLGQKKTHVVALPDFKTYKKDPENDGELVKALHSLFDEADIVIAHNGDKFDQKKSNRRFLMHGLTPPSPFRTVDTLKVARSQFASPSNRLDDLGAHLGLGRKVQHTGKNLWFDCMAGDEKAWDLMKKYNKQDVDLLEAVYNVLVPWAKNHPNVTVYTGEEACPKCSSFNVIKRGIRHTNASSYQRYYCNDCGGWFHEGSAVKGSSTRFRN